MDAAYLFAKSFVDTTYEMLPSDVVEATKKEILDLLGVAVGGFSEPGERELVELYRDWGGNYDPNALSAALGQHFEGINVAIKPYPCCRGIHPAIDAALSLSNEHSIMSDSIQGIQLFVSDEHNDLLCTPRDAKCKPRNPVDAQFSIPWGVATAIIKNRVILADFTDEAIKGPEILEITAKMEIESDPGLKRQDKVDPTRVMITTKQGDVYSKQVENPLGSLQRPMSFDDCTRKFRDCAQALKDEQMDRVIESIHNLEKVNSIEEIVGLLVW